MLSLHPQHKLLSVIFLFFLFSFSLVSAVGLDNPYLPLIRTIVPDTNISVHSASNWDTNIGNLSYVDANQFDNIMNKLTIDTAWLTSFGSGIWCALTGCTMEGDIDMDGNNITNADWIIADVGNFTDLYVSNNSIYIGDTIKLSTENSILNITGGNVSAPFYYGSAKYMTDINLSNVNGTSTFYGDVTINGDLNVTGEIAGGGSQFLLSTEYMKLNPVNTAPETCDATMLGAIYFDTSEDDMCVCKLAGWFVMTDGSACT